MKPLTTFLISTLFCILTSCSKTETITIPPSITAIFKDSALSNPSLRSNLDELKAAFASNDSQLTAKIANLCESQYFDATNTASIDQGDFGWAGLCAEMNFEIGNIKTYYDIKVELLNSKFMWSRNKQYSHNNAQPKTIESKISNAVDYNLAICPGFVRALTLNGNLIDAAFLAGDSISPRLFSFAIPNDTSEIVYEYWSAIHFVSTDRNQRAIAILTQTLRNLRKTGKYDLSKPITAFDLSLLNISSLYLFDVLAVANSRIGKINESKEICEFTYQASKEIYRNVPDTGIFMCKKAIAEEEAILSGDYRYFLSEADKSKGWKTTDKISRYSSLSNASKAYNAIGDSISSHATLAIACEEWKSTGFANKYRCDSLSSITQMTFK
ncbi:MAG: hypothetical protein IPP69_16750 [Flavobacteriales bacterium]|nr:hypothetical protein [Flavobacteriales bacterium]